MNEQQLHLQAFETRIKKVKYKGEYFQFIKDQFKICILKFSCNSIPVNHSVLNDLINCEEPNYFEIGVMMQVIKAVSIEQNGVGIEDIVEFKFTVETIMAEFEVIRAKCEEQATNEVKTKLKLLKK